ncbi:MAG: hypothetical protein MUF16_24370 [Burkholderiaceae bacterium]|nr:hypothetical protein [Burkholderiaceae bacterium]
MARLTAWSQAVWPNSSRRAGSAPLASSASTSGALPAIAASISGVAPTGVA